LSRKFGLLEDLAEVEDLVGSPEVEDLAGTVEVVVLAGTVEEEDHLAQVAAELDKPAVVHPVVDLEDSSDLEEVLLSFLFLCNLPLCMMFET